MRQPRATYGNTPMIVRGHHETRHYTTTNVLHWICFLSPLFIMTTINPIFLKEGVALSLLFVVGGWAIKYVLTGRKGFFPWMTK